MDAGSVAKSLSRGVQKSGTFVNRCRFVCCNVCLWRVRIEGLEEFSEQ